MLVWINGAFGAGKTSVANVLAQRWPEALIFDPEQVGFMLRRVIPETHRTSDFQDLPLWRQLTVETAVGLIDQVHRPLIVPMTMVDRAYFEEIIEGLTRAGVDVRHFALLACQRTLRRRLWFRWSLPASKRWTLRQVDRCVEALASPAFAVHVKADDRQVTEIAAEILAALPSPLPTRASRATRLRAPSVEDPDITAR